MSDFEKADFEKSGPVTSIRIKEIQSVYHEFVFSKSLCSEYKNFIRFHKKSRIYLSSDSMLVYRLCNIYISELVNGVILEKKDFDFAVSEMLLIYHRYGSINDLHRRLPEWIFDLCVVTKRQDILCELFKNNTIDFPLKNDFLIFEYFKEFFSSSQAELHDKLFAFLPCVCGYKYFEMSHFLQNRDVYCQVLCTVLEALFETVSLEEGAGFFVSQKKKVLRSSFDGLCCDSNAFRIFEIEYIPYSENEKLNNLISGAVKYTDNILRQAFGIKTKIMGISLEKQYRNIICDTIREKFQFLNVSTGKSGRKPKPNGSIADYKNKQREIGYEKNKIINEIDISVDFSRAKALEQDSWKLASLFGSQYEGETIEYVFGEKPDNCKIKKTDNVQKPEENDIIEEYDFGDFSELFEKLDKIELDFLICLISGGDIEDYCRSCRRLPLGVSSQINEKAMKYFGDIIVCDSGKILSILPDYYGEISAIIQEINSTKRGGK